MGFEGQLIHWPRSLCEDLAARGCYVIRYDNRDAGLSTKLDHNPQRALSLTSIMSTTGNTRLPKPDAERLQQLTTPPSDPLDENVLIERGIDVGKHLMSPGSDRG